MEETAILERTLELLTQRQETEKEVRELLRKTHEITMKMVEKEVSGVDGTDSLSKLFYEIALKWRVIHEIEKKLEEI